MLHAIRQRDWLGIGPKERLAMGRLDGKVAIIIGGASGMGNTSARLLVEKRARVVIDDVQDEQAHAVALALLGLGARRLFAR
jgi:NAD(P)-dependent dehydrogenase (short-subunit alcohol dehydrogenase family)